jgi:hypothetical protein
LLTQSVQLVPSESTRRIVPWAATAPTRTAPAPLAHLGLELPGSTSSSGRHTAAARRRRREHDACTRASAYCRCSASSSPGPFAFRSDGCLALVIEQHRHRRSGPRRCIPGCRFTHDGAPLSIQSSHRSRGGSGREGRHQRSAQRHRRCRRPWPRPSRGHRYVPQAIRGLS